MDLRESRFPKKPARLSAEAGRLKRRQLVGIDQGGA